MPRAQRSHLRSVGASVGTLEGWGRKVWGGEKAQTGGLEEKRWSWGEGAGSCIHTASAPDRGAPPGKGGGGVMASEVLAALLLASCPVVMVGACPWNVEWGVRGGSWAEGRRPTMPSAAWALGSAGESPEDIGQAHP